jgi:hypothetical protein
VDFANSVLSFQCRFSERTAKRDHFRHSFI